MALRSWGAESRLLGFATHAAYPDKQRQVSGSLRDSVSGSKRDQYNRTSNVFLIDITHMGEI